MISPTNQPGFMKAQANNPDPHSPKFLRYGKVYPGS